MSVPALAIVPVAPPDEPAIPEPADELVGWVRRQIRWETRLGELVEASPASDGAPPADPTA